MRYSFLKVFLLGLTLLMIAGGSPMVAQEVPAEQPPANVAGNWTVYTKGPTGKTATKYIQLKQDGATLSGHFKGPYQSGGLEGTVKQQHIVFRTKTRDVFTFRGQVEGPRVDGVVQATSIKGTVHGRNGTGEWQAVRSN